MIVVRLKKDLIQASYNKKVVKTYYKFKKS